MEQRVKSEPTTDDEPQFGRELFDWISEEKLGPKTLRLLCFGCGETETLTKEGDSFVGFHQFLREHRQCVVYPKPSTVTVIGLGGGRVTALSTGDAIKARRPVYEW